MSFGASEDPTSSNVLIIHFDDTYNYINKEYEKPRRPFNLNYIIAGDFLLIKHENSDCILKQSLSELRELAKTDGKLTDSAALTVDFTPQRIHLRHLLGQSISNKSNLVQIDNLSAQARHSMKCFGTAN